MPGDSGGASKTVGFQLDSSLESVDQAELEVIRVAGAAGLDEEEQHRLGMAVRESMTNAVAHGNKFNRDKKVHLTIRQMPDRLAVQVADEGKGFDLNSIPDPLAEENLLRQSGRGILLIQAFVDEFRVRRGDRGGTEVELIKYLDRKP